METIKTERWVIRHKPSGKYFSGSNFEQWQDQENILDAAYRDSEEKATGIYAYFLKAAAEHPVRSRAKQLVGAENLEIVHIRITVEEIS